MSLKQFFTFEPEKVLFAAKKFFCIFIFYAHTHKQCGLKHSSSIQSQVTEILQVVDFGLQRRQLQSINSIQSVNQSIQSKHKHTIKRVHYSKCIA